MEKRVMYLVTGGVVFQMRRRMLESVMGGNKWESKSLEASKKKNRKK